MIDVSYSYQEESFATPGGLVIRMPKSEKIYSGCVQISDDTIIETVEDYSSILRHTEERIPFSKFLLTKLNNDQMFKTYPRGMFIEDKEYVKALVRNNIPGDVADKYWDINRQLGVSYVPTSDFNAIIADRINGVITKVNSLESVIDEINTVPEKTLPFVPEALRKIYEDEYGEDADLYLNRDFSGTFRVY